MKAIQRETGHSGLPLTSRRFEKQPRSPGRIDRDLFCQFQDGDPEALKEIVSLLHTPLITLIKTYTGSQETSEEIAQDAFLKLYQERASLYGPGSVFPWLCITAKRMAGREIGRKRYRVEMPVAEEVIEHMFESETLLPSQTVLRKELGQHLAAALNKQKEIDRQLILLRFFAGLALREISDALQMPIGSVGTKLQRALKRLRWTLQEKGIRMEDFL